MTEDQTASVDQQGLATNRFALSFYWSNQLGALSKASGQTLEILRPPSVKGTAKDAEQYYKSSMYYSASARTKHPVEAQQFIDFMANSIEAGEIGLADRGIPANSDVRKAISAKLSPADASTAAFIDEISEELGNTVPVPPAGAAAAVEVIGRYALEVHFERLSPADAAQKAMDEIRSTMG